MEYKGIPTLYKGIQFRSRLEARWASFFDLCGWKWEYEPLELSGWIPDFIITSKDKKKILVEVKPTDDLSWFELQKYKLAIKNTVYDVCELLLLGNSVRDSIRDWSSGAAQIGWLVTEYNNELSWDSPEPCICVYDEHDLNIGFMCAYGLYKDRVSGYYWGGHPHICDYEEITPIWFSAGNATQWKRR